MSLFALIPAKVYEYALIVLACALMAFGFIAHERSVGAAKVEAVRQAEHAQAAAVAASAIAANLAETNRRELATKENINATIQQAALVAADAASAASARDALRVQLDAVVAASRRAAGNPAPTAGSQNQPGGDTIGVLAELLDGADRREGVYAELAERRRVTAAACERQYDSLSH